jgi:hypothetical protein
MVLSLVEEGHFGGLTAGDILIMADNQSVSAVSDINMVALTALDALRDSVEIQFLRGGQTESCFLQVKQIVDPMPATIEED